MKDRILKVASQLAKKMADGLVAEPGAPERHRALGVADAYQLLQNEFPDLFADPQEARQREEIKREVLRELANRKSRDLGSNRPDFSTPSKSDS